MILSSKYKNDMGTKYILSPQNNGTWRSHGLVSPKYTIDDKLKFCV